MRAAALPSPRTPAAGAATLAAALVLTAACTTANPGFVPPDADGDADRGADFIQAQDGAALDRTGPGGPDLRTGLLAYWKLDDAEDSTTARDSSGNGHTGTLTNLPARTAWVPGKTGWGIRFGPMGAQTAVRVPAHAAFDSMRSYTLAAWTFRPTARPDSWASVVSRQLGDDNGEVFNLLFTRDQLRAYHSTRAGENTSVASSRTAPVGQWVHAAVTFDGGVLRLYEDGQQVATLAHSYPLASSTKPIYIGTNLNGNGERDDFVGILDEVLIYDRALPPDAVKALADGTMP